MIQFKMLWHLSSYQTKIKWLHHFHFGCICLLYNTQYENTVFCDSFCSLGHCRENGAVQLQYLLGVAPALPTASVAQWSWQKQLCLLVEAAASRSCCNGLLLNVSGHLEGCVDHFLPGAWEEGRTRPECLMCDGCNSLHVFGGFYMMISALLPIVTLVWSRLLKFKRL